MLFLNIIIMYNHQGLSLYVDYKIATFLNFYFLILSEKERVEGGTERE